MDESTITAKTQVKAEPTTLSGETASKFQEWKPLLEVFGLDDSSSYDEALKDIWEYARKVSNLTSSEDIKWQVRKLMADLGTGDAGERSYTKLLNYVHVCNRLENDKELKRKMEDNA